MRIIMLYKVCIIYGIVIIILLNVKVNSECQMADRTQFWSTAS